jgi:hypothetical protein
MRTVTNDIHATIKRINRKLSRFGLTVHKSRPFEANTLGEFFATDIENGLVEVDKISRADLASYELDPGALAAKVEAQFERLRALSASQGRAGASSFETKLRALRDATTSYTEIAASLTLIAGLDPYLFMMLSDSYAKAFHRPEDRGRSEDYNEDAANAALRDHCAYIVAMNAFADAGMGLDDPDYQPDPATMNSIKEEIEGLVNGAIALDDLEGMDVGSTAPARGRLSVVH